jgi:hypothetical protein
MPSAKGSARTPLSPIQKIVAYLTCSTGHKHFRPFSNNGGMGWFNCYLKILSRKDIRRAYAFMLLTIFCCKLKLMTPAGRKFEMATI